MIIGQFHQGSGLGNQLARLVATRVRAADLGVDWAMMYNHDNSGKEKGFKGSSFMDIGQWDKSVKKTVHHFNPGNIVIPGQNLPTEPEIECGNWQEKCVRDEFGNDIRSYDPEFNFIEDNTIIEGEFQDERYWEHREKEVNEWLKVEPLDMSDDLCVISHRGGEFALFPDLYLPQGYWDFAISEMRKINPTMKFQVQTDDEVTAKKTFPEFEVIHEIGYNWRAIRYARYLIVGNSSFSILPSWLNKNVQLTLAPKYHGRHNVGVWSMAQNFYKKYTYIAKEQYP